jgi:hypothetical protein
VDRVAPIARVVTQAEHRLPLVTAAQGSFGSSVRTPVDGPRRPRSRRPSTEGFEAPERGSSRGRARSRRSRIASTHSSTGSSTTLIGRDPKRSDGRYRAENVLRSLSNG